MTPTLMPTGPDAEHMSDPSSACVAMTEQDMSDDRDWLRHVPNRSASSKPLPHMDPQTHDEFRVSGVNTTVQDQECDSDDHGLPTHSFSSGASSDPAVED